MGRLVVRGFLLGFVLLVACNEDPDPGHLRMDATTVPIVIVPNDVAIVPTNDARADASAVVDAACEAGQRACGTMCVGQLPNDPENGCSFGCPNQPCSVPENAEGACTADGRCIFRCPPPFNQVGGQCICAPQNCTDQGFECGMQTDRCGGTQNCGTCSNNLACNSGRCGCSQDRFEPNNTQSTATARESLNDNNNRTVEVVGINFHSDQDQDWFSYSVSDGNDFGNPKLRVRLQQIPSGADFDLAAYYLCTSGNNDSGCDAGTVDNAFGHGCASMRSGSMDEEVLINTNCTGTGTDTGVLYVKVIPRTRANSCANYRLEVYIR